MKLFTASTFHTCTGAAVRSPMSIFGCERLHILVSSPGWPCASPEKRGTPASIISTFTQVKNQTFSFHFFSWVQQGGYHCRAWEAQTWGGSDGLHVGFCVLSDVQPCVYVLNKYRMSCPDGCKQVSGQLIKTSVCLLEWPPVVCPSIL